MAEFADIFPAPKPITAGATKEEQRKFEELSEGLQGNIAAMVTEEGDLRALKAQLDKRNIHIGDMIGVGGMGGITYTLKDGEGKTLESVVMRLDPADMITPIASPNPAAIQPILCERAGYVAATIVPKAKLSSLNVKDQETLSPEEQAKNISRIKDAMAVLNTDGVFPHLKDLAIKQFMEIPGLPMPVLTDLSCISREPNTMTALGTADTFIEAMGWNRDAIYAAKVPDAKMQELRDAQKRIHDTAVSELKEAGVIVDAVPSKQDGAKLTPLTTEIAQAVGK